MKNDLLQLAEEEVDDAISWIQTEEAVRDIEFRVAQAYGFLNALNHHNLILNKKWMALVERLNGAATERLLALRDKLNVDVAGLLSWEFNDCLGYTIPEGAPTAVAGGVA